MSCNCKKPPAKKTDNSYADAIEKASALLEFIDDKKAEGIDLFLKRRKDKAEIIKFRRKDNEK